MAPVRRGKCPRGGAHVTAAASPAPTGFRDATHGLKAFDGAESADRGLNPRRTPIFLTAPTRAVTLSVG